MLKSDFFFRVQRISQVSVLTTAVIFLVPQCLLAQAPPPTSQQQQQTQSTAPVKSANQTKATVQNQSVSASGQIQSPSSSSQTTTQFMTSSSPLSASSPQPVKQTTVSKASALQTQTLSGSQKLTPASTTSTINVGKTQPISRRSLTKTNQPVIAANQPVAITGPIPVKGGQQSLTVASTQPISGQLPARAGQRIATVGTVQTISGSRPVRPTSSSPAPVTPVVIQSVAATPLQPAPGLQNVPSPNVPSISLQPASSPSTPVAAPLTLSAPSNIQTIALAPPMQFPQGFLPNVKNGDEITKGIQNYWTNIAGIQPTGVPALISAAQTILGGYNVSISTGTPPANYFNFKLINQNGVWLVTESAQSDANKNIIQKDSISYDPKGRLEARKTEQYFQGQLSAVYTKKYDQGQMIFESENLIGSGGQPSRLTTKEYLNGQLTLERQDYTDAKGQKLRAFEKRYENGLLTADFSADNTGLQNLTLKKYDKQGNVIKDEKWFSSFNGKTYDNFYTVEQIVTDPAVPGGQYSTFVRYKNGQIFSFNISAGNNRVTAELTANGWVNYSPGANNAIIRDIDQFIIDSTAKLQVPSTAIDLNQKVPAFPRGFTL